MSLNLDARQRAMLQEMGITLWLPTPVAAQPDVSALAPTLAPAPAVEAVVAPRPMATAQAAPIEGPATAPTTEAFSAPASAPVPEAVSAKAQSATQPVAPATPVPPTDAAAAVWHMAPLVQLYAPAVTEAAPAAVNRADAWLVLLESPCPMTPLAGDVGRLLDNMLRALRLEQHPQVWLAGLQRPGSEALPVAGSMEPVDWQPLAPTLRDALAQVQPARVLVLGQAAAWAVLQRHEPLGQLRAQVHDLHGTPAVVTYDPAYLLRAAHAKPGAWADLCLAAAQPPTIPAA